MKKPNITPGEWVIDKFDSDFRLSVVSTPVLIAHVADKHNAKAISAVPVMIDELIDELEYLKSIEGIFSKDFEQGLMSRIKAIESTLKKAGVKL